MSNRDSAYAFSSSGVMDTEQDCSGTFDYHKCRMSVKALENLKINIRNFRKKSHDYSYEISTWDRAFALAFKIRPPSDMASAVHYQSRFVTPLLMMKDHADVAARALELMLPDEEKPYRPQEPAQDPFLHIRRRFR